MELRYSKQARKYLQKMQRGAADTLKEELAKVARGLEGYEGHLIKMTNNPYYRLRVGAYRAILDVQNDTLVLLVLKIGPGGDVYK